MNKRTYSQILDDAARDRTPAGLDLTPQIMTRIQKGKVRIMKPRMKVLTAVLLVLLAFVVLFFTVPGVAAAIQKWFGYVPGVGLVREGEIRVLAEPVSVTREGITVTVEQVLLDSERTVLIYSVEGIPGEAITLGPGTRCPYEVSLRLPDGTVLSSGAGGGDMWDTGYEHRFDYPALPVDINDVDLLISCLFRVLPGAAPENWEIPLHFVPAPPDMTAFPVFEISTPTEPAAAGAAEQTPVSDSLADRLSLTIDRAVQMDDGYLIYASMHWQESPNLNNVSMRSLNPTVHLLDAGGQEVLYEEVYEDTGGGYDEQRTIFALKTAPIQTSGPLTLVVDSVTVSMNTDASFIFDPGANPQPGQTYSLNTDVQIGKYALTVVSAERVDSNGYDFVVKSDSGIYNVNLMNLDYPPNGGGGGGNDVGDDSFSTEISASLYYPDNAPPGPITVSITWMDVRQDGPWQAQWTPPAASPKVIPTHPAACLNASTWKQALSQNPPLPQEMGGRVILFGPGTGASGEWVISLGNLDGSNPQVFTGARDASLSPDGSKLAYSSADGISLLDFASGQSTKLPGTVEFDFNPVWSPDGSQIVFMRGNGRYDLFLIKADGSGLRALTDGGLQEWPVGWMPDGLHLIYTVPGRENEYANYQVDVGTGESQLFSNENLQSISPDGKYKITQEKVFGDRWVLYVSDIDGSNRWALTGPDIWALVPLWSPDGQWLMLSVSDTDSGSTIGALLRLADCTIIPLPYLKGEVTSWLP